MGFLKSGSFFTATFLVVDFEEEDETQPIYDRLYVCPDNNLLCADLLPLYYARQTSQGLTPLANAQISVVQGTRALILSELFCCLRMHAKFTNPRNQPAAMGEGSAGADR